MNGFTGESAAPSAGYEFTADQNKVIRSTASRVKIWGGFILTCGGLTLLGAFALFLTREVAGVVVGVIYALIALIPIYIGLNFVRAGGALGAVVGTEGNDIDHLMGALKNLGTAFLIQVVAAAVWVAVIILGIVAAVAIPQFADTRDRAYLAAQRSDLRNLASQEEIFYADSYRYSADLAALRFVASNGVTITISEASEGGWAATTTHEATPGEGCAVYYGSAMPPMTAGGSMPEKPGTVLCDG